MTQPPPAGGKALAEIIAERRRKAEQLRRAGIAPWGVDFRPSLNCAEASRRVPAEPGQLGESA
ncbi:MAG: hypothetical protein WBF51_09620, partial [Candidatus Dormiibacterota bacterium]